MKERMKRYTKPINGVIDVRPIGILMGSNRGLKTNIGLGLDDQAIRGGDAW